MFPGLRSRLEKDIQHRYLNDILKGDVGRLQKFRLGIEEPPSRKYLVFQGGSILADLMKDRDTFWITKSDYAEYGVDRAFANIRL
mmetsp:Transcript_11760/g.17447  ORF Transcript_11760/g.17447 Transcript_11760/m.17447 type:complete len:85 (+) Transcript_11760:162-416(+)